MGDSKSRGFSANKSTCLRSKFDHQSDSETMSIGYGIDDTSYSITNAALMKLL